MPPQNLQTLFSAKGFKSKSEFTAFVLTALEERYQPTSASLDSDIYFVDIPQGWGKRVFFAVVHRWEYGNLRKTRNSVAQTLRFRMPSPTHNCAQSWLAHCLLAWQFAGDLYLEEVASLNVVAGNRLELSRSLYSNSLKEPDVSLYPDGYDLRPPNAFEVSWSETADGLDANELDADAELLLRESNPAIRVVVNIKWCIDSSSRTVRGTLSAWRLDPYETPYMTQHEVIFPAPQPPRPQYLELSLTDIFSSAVAPGRDPLDALRLDIGLLRRKATFSFNAMNLIPA
ncbi:uncharacterized protein N7496_001178 [Penicillium cataractarum]|uniref:Uncharacterized protein n=1 Tax=Penicillium cataractarum TaxID=2100454 RepID=A0A9X0B6N7_9EURO|nr:uncharacterized protein N7496_001178 [Penicillium cataractarum]KAJ5390110.1 hypothetical protein N7496_001178 [Penicillium cataractarum]